LAYLQYYWLGKVSEREREQMQTALQQALSQLSRDFDREIARILIQFENRPEHVRDAATHYANVYSDWKSKAPYPQLAHALFLLQGNSSSQPSLQRLNAASGKWEPADWIAEFGARRDLNVPIDARIPALVMPLFRFDFDVAAEPFELPDEDRLIVRLNLDYIQKEFLPMLVRTHLANAGRDYYVQIRGEDDSRIIFSSAPSTTIRDEGDASEPILIIRPDEFRGLQPAEAFITTEAISHVPADRLFAFHVMPGIVGMSRVEGHETFAKFNFNEWRLTAVHRSGSLDAAVGQIRRRNLALSFSILGLLSASVAIIVVSSARAQRLARQQMEFVSTVSHELRTPLAVICSAGENLADGVVREAEHLKDYGKVVRNEGRRLSEMVEQILCLAGIQSTLKKQTFVPLDVAQIVQRAVHAFESLIQEKGITVENRILQDVPSVMGDPASLTRAVQNLISNALKYGGPERWIGLSVFTEGRWVKIAVQDKGAGIPSSDLPHIFEAFYRGRAPIDAQIQGSGLGLSLVKQAVDAHGGRIDVSSNIGAGSTFCLSLPIANAPEASRS
jgi:signal transduction histidine kinase